MTGLTFTDVKELNTGKDSTISLKLDFSNIDGKDFMKALEGASNTTLNYAPIEQPSQNINYNQDSQMYAPKDTAAREFIVSNNIEYNQQNNQVNKQPEVKESKETEKDLISSDNKKEEKIKKEDKKENVSETEKNLTSEKEKTEKIEAKEKTNTSKLENIEEKDTKLENKPVKVTVQVEKEISSSEITAKTSNKSSTPKSEEISRESLGLKSSKDYLPEVAILNRNTEFGVKFGNSIENKSKDTTSTKEINDKNTGNIAIQMSNETKNIQKDSSLNKKPEVQNKKLEVLVEDKQAESLKKLVNSDQKELSASTQKTLEDVFNKNGAAKPVVTKIEVQSNTDKQTSQQQKNGQNLAEDQTSKIANQLLQGSEQNISSITGSKNVVFEKILDSQISAKINSESILDQVSQKVSADINVGKSEITMSLRPESLGKVEINLVSEKGIISAEITAENSDVKEVLTKEIDTLKQKLADQNINLDKVTVKIQEPSQTTNNDQNFDKDSKNYDQQFQNMNNDSNFDKHTHEKSGSGQINKMESSEDIELNLANENESENIHNGLVDYRI